ncbi:MAG: FKBP-type peptidyl-prolyl cis-trans isomerase [Flavobacteriaceae bacterium]|nr:FKBP-type peptidyl-prolyl cis-trans isomerase [Flavobacteriaceae bacterium]
MKEGSKAKLIVPFHIAYGYSDTQGIPIGSVLVFDIEVIAINEGIDFLTKNEEDIAEYIEENNLDPIKTESGLYYIIEEQGEGDFPTETSKVTVRYEGYFLNGDVFSRNTTDGITTTLDKVIPGWKEGIQLFKEGGKGKLIIPFNLGYGYVRKSTIPVGSVLVFNIELTDVSL